MLIRTNPQKEESNLVQSLGNDYFDFPTFQFSGNFHDQDERNKYKIIEIGSVVNEL